MEKRKRIKKVFSFEISDSRTLIVVTQQRSFATKNLEKKIKFGDRTNVYFGVAFEQIFPTRHILCLVGTYQAYFQSHYTYD